MWLSLFITVAFLWNQPLSCGKNTFKETRYRTWSPLRWETLWVPSGEGNGNPLQYSCLENPVDGGGCGLLSIGPESRTRLKQLSMHGCMHAWVPRGQVPPCPAAREVVKNTGPSPRRCGRESKWAFGRGWCLHETHWGKNPLSALKVNEWNQNRGFFSVWGPSQKQWLKTFLFCSIY